jgi:hypothetical protein
MPSGRDHVFVISYTFGLLSAWVWVLGSHQLKTGGKSQRTLGAADGDGLVFHGLAHDFQHAWTELGQLIQEKHAAVSQADLARKGPISAADQRGVTDGMVRGAKGTRAEGAAHPGVAGRRPNRCG